MKFNKKNQKQIRKQRNTNERPQAFSYYANRSAKVNNGSSLSRRHKESPRPIIGRFFEKSFLKEIPGLLALFVIIFSLLYASTLSVSQTKVRAINKTASTQALDLGKYEKYINRQIQSSIFNRSKFSINTKSIESDVMNAFPELSGVAVTVPLISRQPLVLLSFETPAMVIGTDSAGYIINSSGRAFAETINVPSSFIADVPVIEDRADIPLEIGSVAVPQDLVVFILQVIAQSKVDGPAIDKLFLPTIANELHIKPVDAQYILKLNTSRSARLQIGSYQAFIADNDQGRAQPQEYIDLRVAGKVFVK